MAFFTINGVTVEVAGDAMNEGDEDIGDTFTRAIDGEGFGNVGMVKRAFTVKTRLVAAELQRRLRRWIKGEIQGWSFAEGRSGSGIVSDAESGILTFGVSKLGTAGAALQIEAGGEWEVYMGNKSYQPRGWTSANGWTLGFRASGDTEDGTGTLNTHFFDFVIKGTGDLVRGTAKGSLPNVTEYQNAVVGDHGLNHLVDIQDATIKLTGNNQDGSSYVKHYAAFWFAPFEVPEEWITGINDCMAALQIGMAPRVTVGGDVAEGEPFDAICRVGQVRQQNARLPGQASASPLNRVIDVDVREV